MIPENEIDMGGLREAVTALNNTTLLEAKIKVVGLSKKVMIGQFADGVETIAKDGKDGELPEVVKQFYNNIFRDELQSEGGGEAPPETETDPDPGEDKPAEEKDTKPDEKKKDKPPAKKKDPKPKSRYGHVLNSQAGNMDDLFFKGAKLAEIAEKVGVKVGRVRGHLNHLRKDKELTINEIDGLFKVAE